MENKDRLILINQYEILKALYPEESEFYSEKIEILQEGYVMHYDDLFGEISDELTKEDSRFVIDILNMYRDINFSKNSLIESEKSRLFDTQTNFRGFDYNDEYEVKLGFYAKFFIETLDRFKELTEDESFDGFNSHWQMKERYTEYLSQYKKLTQLENYKFGKMTVEQIKEVLR